MSLELLPPPGDALKGYNSAQIHAQQDDENIPELFRDAMSVREEVYVEEQKVPLENEFDYDDPRCYHWVAYASVGTTGAQAKDDSGEGRRKSSTAQKLAVGTIRLVPPPHPPHPEPGSSHKIDNAESGQPQIISQPEGSDHNKEPYIKLGRLAILKAFRGLGLSHLLINAALDWAISHPNDILPPMSPTATEHKRLELGAVAEDKDHWNGLVLVHAQTAIEDKIWAKYGFVKDETMGEWDEEGIMHIGMWKRLEVAPQRSASLASP